ncbi:unnamed protein product, partial [Prorocentrum cordatum]
AHAAAIQEHHLATSDSCKEAEAWCLRNGWKGMFSPANPGEGEGSSGGVAVLGRNFLGLHPLTNLNSDVVPSRA